MNKEIPEWILEKLCYYDERNPNNFLEEDLIKDEDELKLLKRDCQCDNCFYGKTRLANELVKMYEKEFN